MPGIRRRRLDDLVVHAIGTCIKAARRFPSEASHRKQGGHFCLGWSLLMKVAELDFSNVLMCFRSVCVCVCGRAISGASNRVQAPMISMTRSQTLNGRVLRDRHYYTLGGEPGPETFSGACARAHARSRQLPVARRRLFRGGHRAQCPTCGAFFPGEANPRADAPPLAATRDGDAQTPRRCRTDP